MKAVIAIRESDYENGERIAAKRTGESKRKGFHRNKNTVEFVEGSELLGVLGEIAFGIHIGEPLVGEEGTFQMPDVKDYQVKTSKYKNCHLIIRRDATDLDRQYVLVEQHSRLVFIIHGCITPREAMRDKFWRPAQKNSKEAAWWVPQNYLN